MELSDYEQKRGEDRQLYVKIHCEYCGTEKWVRWGRVKNGQGRFCSLLCGNKSREKLGREGVYFYLDDLKQRWIARWRDPVTRKFHVQHRAKFVWEEQYGPVPEGFDVHHIDENQQNDDLSNLELVEGHLHKQGIHGSNRKIIDGVVHKMCFRCKRYFPESSFTQTYCGTCWPQYMRGWRND